MVKEFNDTKSRVVQQLILSLGPEGLLPFSERVKPSEKASKLIAKKGSEEFWFNVVEHSQTVAKVAKAIGQLVHLSQDQLEKLELAALAHETGKREEVLGTKIGKYSDRKTAEYETHKLLVQELGIGIVQIIRGTSILAMEEYYQGKLAGNDEFLTRLLFFSDEICNGSDIIPWQERIATWTDETLRTKPVDAYGGQTQAEIESKFAAQVEQEIRQTAGISKNANLVSIIKDLVNSS